jgi:septal ring factor EnvC (AmiA/AmiB activator)
MSEQELVKLIAEVRASQRFIEGSCASTEKHLKELNGSVAKTKTEIEVIKADRKARDYRLDKMEMEMEAGVNRLSFSFKQIALSATFLVIVSVGGSALSVWRLGA